MTLAADIVTFKTGTGTDPVDVLLPNLDVLGVAPSVIWVYGIGRTDETDAVGAINLALSYGFGVSTTARRCLAGQSDSGVTPSATDVGFRDDCIMAHHDIAGAVAGRADIGAIDIGTVQLAIDQAFPSDLTGVMVAIGGTDITAATIVNFSVVSAQTGPFSIDAVGFVPKYVEQLSAFRTGGYFGAQAVWTYSIGRTYLTGPVNQVLGGGSADAVATVDSWRSLNSTNSYEYHNGAANVDVRGRITGPSTTGFVNTVLEAGVAGTRTVAALCIAGSFQMSMGNVTSLTDTSSTTDVVMTFSPVLTHLWGHGTTITTANSNQAVMRASLGSFLDVGTGVQAGIGWVDPETNPSSGASAFSVNDSYLNVALDGTLDGAGGADGGEVPPETGWRLKMSDADPTGTYLVYASFGPGPNTSLRDMIDGRMTIPFAR